MYLKKLIELRRNFNISQTELGRQLGVSPQVVNSWETGRAKPPMEQIRKAAEYFNVSFDYLFNDDPNNPEIKINQALNESNLSTPEENFTMEEFERAVDIIREFRAKEKELEEKIRKEYEERNKNE